MADIIGGQIDDYRPLTDEELAAEGWSARGQEPHALVLDTGVLLYPSQDSEGNGPGALIGVPDDVVGRSLTAITSAPESTLEELGWMPLPRGQEAVAMLVVDETDGVIPMRDPEGNAPGELFGRDGNDEFYLSP